MSDMLSQEEINALLAGASDDEASSGNDTASASNSILTEEEKDALGEIGNISMGTAATTLFTLLNQKVTITTPRVRETTIEELFSTFEAPCVTIDVKYTVGLEGTNLMILDAEDVKVITDLMLGGDGTNTDGELSEMHLSAISEAMNQMIGSSSTSLSEMIGKMIDISPPVAISKAVDEVLEEFKDFPNDEPSVIISFDMKIGDLVDSEIMQMMPLSMARGLLKSVMSTGEEEEQSVPEEVSAPEEAQPVQPVSSQAVSSQTAPSQTVSPEPQSVYASNPAPSQAYIAPEKPTQPVSAQPVSFQSFDNGMDLTHISSDIALIKEVPLDISVELGRTVKRISEILDFGSGSIIELNKIVGEPLDILANGKIIARGEVVVIEENYGVRITEIVVPEKA